MGSTMLFAIVLFANFAWSQAGNSSLVTNEQLNEIKGKITRLDTLLNEVKEPGASLRSSKEQNRNRRQTEEIFIDDERLNFIRPNQITEHIYMSTDRKKRHVEDDEVKSHDRQKRCGHGRPKGIPPPGWRPRATTAAPIG